MHYKLLVVQKSTAPGGMREDFVVDGVIGQQDGSYAPSTIKVSQQDYWQAIGTGNTGIGEANIYDATNIRLRNIALIILSRRLC